MNTEALSTGAQVRYLASMGCPPEEALDLTKVQAQWLISEAERRNWHRMRPTEKQVSFLKKHYGFEELPARRIKRTEASRLIGLKLKELKSTVLL